MGGMGIKGSAFCSFTCPTILYSLPKKLPFFPSICTTFNMVSLSEVEHSNSSVASTLPSGLVAVFAGATAGIGETALKAFAKYTVKPKIYFIGRSREAGDRLLKELNVINSEGAYEFVQADMSLLANVDKVCQDIKSKESVVNVLFMSQGTLKYGVG